VHQEERTHSTARGKGQRHDQDAAGSASGKMTWASVTKNDPPRSAHGRSVPTVASIQFGAVVEGNDMHARRVSRVQILPDFSPSRGSIHRSFRVLALVRAHDNGRRRLQELVFLQAPRRSGRRRRIWTVAKVFSRKTRACRYARPTTILRISSRFPIRAKSAHDGPGTVFAKTTFAARRSNYWPWTARNHGAEREKRA